MRKTSSLNRSGFLLAVCFAALTLPLSVAAKKGGDGGGLALTKVLAAEFYEDLLRIVEGNELLIYDITLSNRTKKAKTTSLTEIVPAGARYAGEDNLDVVCVADHPAGTSCELEIIRFPGKGNTTLNFNIIVDNQITAATIDNTAQASDADCAVSDCSKSIPTTTIGTSTGFSTVSQSDWTETSVRKVLQAFAYGGLATDAQITAWALMNPAAAVDEMLTFTYTNEKLSPAEDASGAHADSLESLQGFWGDQDDASNPMRWDKRRLYPTLGTATDGTTGKINAGNLERTWIQAVNTRGINPFPHNVAFFLTNYQMSNSTSKAGNGLFRSYYDQTVADLVNDEPFTTIIATAAKSAATARQYGHRFNKFNNSSLTFSGNDDFAREFFQLFFRYNGINESFEYHESVNIENNARLLTGMKIDRLTNAYGSKKSNDWFISPILFADHVDETGRNMRNQTHHHADCLEIFHQMVCGSTAADKIDALAAIVSSDPEVLENLPAYIISYFADDQLTPDKIAKISAHWAASSDNLLAFLRAYAISTTFHSEDTVKFRSTFNRNLVLYNSVVLDNEEAFVGRQHYDSPRNEMRNQGGVVFQPAHDVFGGQTGTEAADNPNIFKSAYDSAGLYTHARLARTTLTYDTDTTGAAQATWDKDWGSVIPTKGGQYVVGDVADWLWQRIVADGGKNFDVIARAQVLALLARGHDFGYAVTLINDACATSDCDDRGHNNRGHNDRGHNNRGHNDRGHNDRGQVISTNPETTYSSLELTGDAYLVAVMDTLAAETMALDDSNVTGTRRTANRRVSYAANFIAMLPYTFATEGK